MTDKGRADGRAALAKAWDEGHQQGWVDAAKSEDEARDFVTPNPYAAAPVAAVGEQTGGGEAR